ncbi:MAG: ECF transporter S component [Oscillospiraceae bacterium]|jgi:uncharacterized membrane protein|nr:ECF transporter S component [Oscillospiraceae bacterium]
MANTNNSRAIRPRTLMLVQFSILLALQAIICFTPLGSLPALGPIVMTLMMIPVVITGILLGPKAGTLMGFCAGFFSFMVWTFMPPSPVVAFLFTPFYSLGEIQGNFASLLICFVPRTIGGTIAGLIPKFFKSGNIAGMITGAALGSLANTLGVLGGIALFFAPEYSDVAGRAIMVVMSSMIITSGLPEATLAAFVAPAVCKPVQIFLRRAID